MRIDLSGKRALVVGGSRGIGAEIGVCLASCGAQLWLTFDKSENEAAIIVDRVIRQGGVARAVRADAASWRLCAQVVAEAQPDLLVYCAGVVRDSMCWKMQEADYDRVLAVNLKGLAGYIQAAAPAMRDRGQGAIVAISSINAQRGKMGQAAYAASKAGLEAFVRCAAIELGPRGIRVNAVAPGWIETDMTRILPQEVRARALSQSKLGRLGEPADVAPVVAFLCSDWTRHVTGQVLAVDGGQLLG